MKTKLHYIKNLSLSVVMAGSMLITLQAAPNQALANNEEVDLRVARLADRDGPAKVLRINDENWTDGMINMPLMAGDQVVTGPAGRAVLELEDGVMMFMEENTQLFFAFMDDGLEQIEVVQGTVSVSAPTVTYDRPPLRIKGEYFNTLVLGGTVVRYDVNESNQALVAVKRGEIRVYRNDESHFRIQTGTTLVVRNPDPSSYTIRPSDPDDAFDAWVNSRDPLGSVNSSPDYISSRIAGRADLDAHGTWVNVPDYGRVWRPRVSRADWAPYRYGEWYWRDPYGWVWVAEEPWGWAPYHYGRWVHVDRYDWVWVPRDVLVVRSSAYHYRRPVWYPALVSFTYANHNSFISLSFGSGYRHRHSHYVGWFPLGPRDHYHGHYHHRRYRVDRSNRYYHFGDTYVDRSVNITNVNNVTNITNVYQNQYVNNAITVVPRDEFAAQRTERVVAGATFNRNSMDRVEVGNQAINNVPRLNEPSARQPRVAIARNPQRVAPSAVTSLSSNSRNSNNNNVNANMNSNINTSAPRAASERGLDTRDVRGANTAAANAPQTRAPRSNANVNEPKAPDGVIDKSLAGRSVSESRGNAVNGQNPSVASPADRNARPERATGNQSGLSTSGVDRQAPRSAVSAQRDARDSSSERNVSPSSVDRSSRPSDSRAVSPQRNERPTSSGSVQASPQRNERAPQFSTQRSNGSGNTSERNLSPSRSNTSNAPSSRSISPQRNERPSSSGSVQASPQRNERAPLFSTQRSNGSGNASERNLSPSRSNTSNAPSSRSISPQRNERPSSSGSVQASPSRNTRAPQFSTQRSNGSGNASERNLSPSRSSSSSAPSSRSISPQRNERPSTSGSAIQRSSARPSFQSESRSPSRSTSIQRSAPSGADRTQSIQRSQSSSPRVQSSPSRSTSRAPQFDQPSQRSSRTFSTQPSRSSSSSNRSSTYSPTRSSPSTNNYSTRNTSPSRSYSPSRSSAQSSPSRSFNTSPSRSSSSNYSAPSRSTQRSFSAPSRSSSSYSPSRSSSVNRSSGSSSSYSPRTSSPSRSSYSAPSQSSSRNVSPSRSSGSTSSSRTSPRR